VPAIAKILTVFASILVFARLKVQLGVALAVGGLVLNLWAGLSLTETSLNLINALCGAEMWLLLAITALIIEVGRFITEKRNAEEIISATQRWGGRHGRSASLMALPAVIGLIPMPAGALFSAPFVGQIAGEDAGPPAWKSAVNYWFRHVWEYWWPLYPGVIIAAAIFEMDIARLISVQFPFTLVAAAGGYYFLIHPHVAGLKTREVPEKSRSGRAMFLLTPLLVVLLSVFLLPPILGRALPSVTEQTGKFLSVLFGLLAAMVIIFVDELRLSRKSAGARVLWPRRLFSSLPKRSSVNVLLSLTGILIFKSLLTESGLLPLASDELVGSGIPLIAAVAMLPFLAGLVTGIALGFTGAAFPLVVGLMGAEGSSMTPFATLVLAYGCGYMGMMLSPVHLCFLVTKDHFNADMLTVYKRILPCVATVLVYSIAIHMALAIMGW